MERLILWTSLFIGIALFSWSLTKPYKRDTLFIFFFTAYISVFLGVLVVEEKWLSYPIKFLDDHFDSNMLYECLILPVVCILYYQTTLTSPYRSILFQGFLYTSVLTILEFIFERYTDLIEYHGWTLAHTFIGVYLLMLFVRLVMKGLYASEIRNGRVP